MPTTTPAGRGSPIFPQLWDINCWEALSWEDEGQKGFQDMFLKQWQNSSRNIVPEQLIQWSPVKLKLDGIASFVIKGIEARDKRKIKS